MMAGIAARELDRLADITEGHTWLLESVVEDVRAQTLAKISRVLGVTIDWLVTGQGGEPSEREVKAAVEAARYAYSRSKPATGTDD
jgi:hypothetical protein